MIWLRGVRRSWRRVAASAPSSMPSASPAIMIEPHGEKIVFHVELRLGHRLHAGHRLVPSARECGAEVAAERDPPHRLDLRSDLRAVHGDPEQRRACEGHRAGSVGGELLVHVAECGRELTYERGECARSLELLL